MTFFAFLVGMFSLILSVIAIVVMFLMRKNMLDILNKDTLVFSKNYEIKKQAFDKAMFVLDDIQLGAPRSNTVEYSRKMNQIYNDLLTVSSDVRIADTFYAMVKDTSKQLTEADFASFKLLVRKELGLNTKSSTLNTKSKQQENPQE
jgi:hypothetical protein